MCDEKQLEHTEVFIMQVSTQELQKVRDATARPIGDLRAW